MVQSPDVELVEPEAVTVKEEKVEPNGSEEEKTEPDVQLIGDDGKYGIEEWDGSVTLLFHLVSLRCVDGNVVGVLTCSSVSYT